MKNEMTRPDYGEAIRKILRSTLPPGAMKNSLEDYHAGDLADALSELKPNERRRFFSVLSPEIISDVLERGDDPARTAAYLNELDMRRRAAVLGHMDSDALADVLRSLPSKERGDLLEQIGEQGKAELALLNSFNDSEIGSRMSTNFVSVPETVTVKQALRSVVEQAANHDNVNTIYATDADGCYCGAFELKDLIVAREGEPLDAIIVAAFPYVYAWEPVDECVELLKDYSEDSIPILDNRNHLLGVLTSQDLVQLVDDEMGEDYARLAGLSSEEDLDEPLRQSVKKRLPWLVILLGLGLIVSGVVSEFESVVQRLTIIICFQSLILDMSGNVGTQSLAVTIRVLMDENLTAAEKLRFTWKELRVGALNGLLLGALGFAAIGLYIMLAMHRTAFYAFAISGCIGVSLLVSMIISSLTGVVIPMAFKKIGVDPAVASGPLITTVNDLVAVVTYYGLAWLLLLECLKLA